MNKSLTLIVLISILLNAETLFQVKDSSDNVVLDVASDGLRIFNEGDTLMVISSGAIKAFIDQNAQKGLARSFSVTSSTNIKSGQANVMEVTTDATTMREGNAGERYTDFSPSNVFLGLNAGQSTTSGSDNVFLGNNTGILNEDGSENVFVGREAGYSSLSLFRSTFIGTEAGYLATGGLGNTFVGWSSGSSSSTGDWNSFYGTSAGALNYTGSNNTYLGVKSGMYNDGGVSNCLVGYLSGYGSTTSSYSNNCLFGVGAGSSLTSGSDNVILGYYAGSQNNTGSGNVFLGYFAGRFETGSDKLYIDNTDTSSPLIYGEFDNDLLRINGDLSVVGTPTLGSLLVAPSEATSGDDAEIILAEDNDGTYNMSMKYDGGSNRLEWWAEDDAGTYGPLMYLSYNTLGGGIPYFYTGFLRPMSDNLYDLGASTLRWDDIYATNGVIQSSDKRQKSNIDDMNYGLSTVMKMRPVTYMWKDKPERGRKVGLVAQELINIIPEIVDVGEDENRTLGINYAELTTVLIKAIQEQQKEIEAQNLRIKNLEEAVEELLK